MKAYLLIILLVPAQLFAGSIVSELPEQTDPSMKYVFYLHGKIIEQELRPTHPRWGLYDYPAVLEALAQDGITVVSEQRAQGTDSQEYAQHVSDQVRQLMETGVSPGNITVVGFSVGGAIAMMTSSLDIDDNINFVFIASCSAWLKGEKALRLHGNVLSIYEKSDGPSSCAPIAKRQPRPVEFEEIEINTGKEHGAFYLPRDEWVEPVLNWVRSH